jgi:hypothetical protein
MSARSFALVRDMRSVPFGLEDISRLAAVTAAPFLPLLLTIWSPEELWRCQSDVGHQRTNAA